MGLIPMILLIPDPTRSARPARNRASRLSMLAACVLAPMLASGCKEVKDVGEELGWIKREERTLPVVDTSLATHWIPADSAVADASQAQWSERWWQWVSQAGSDEVPYMDPDGRYCALRQGQGPVWFLAGTDGNFDVVRTCRIPAGRHLFVPMINWNVSRGSSGETISCAEKREHASRLADHVISGLVILDGHAVGTLERMRVASTGCFVAPDGEAGASDGYWLMLKPLPPGKHQLAIAATFRHGPKESMQNFRYELEVEGPDGRVPVAVQ